MATLPRPSRSAASVNVKVGTDFNASGTQAGAFAGSGTSVSGGADIGGRFCNVVVRVRFLRAALTFVAERLPVIVADVERLHENVTDDEKGDVDCDTEDDTDIVNGRESRNDTLLVLLTCEGVVEIFPSVREPDSDKLLDMDVEKLLVMELTRVVDSDDE
jgi:hypothetical protein